MLPNDSLQIVVHDVQGLYVQTVEELVKLISSNVDSETGYMKVKIFLSEFNSQMNVINSRLLSILEKETKS